MMRKKLSVVIPALLAASAAHAVEVYNKEGHKLNLYGKADARHMFSSNSDLKGDDSYLRFGFQGEAKINDELAGYGQWEYNIKANKPESAGTEGTATRLGFAGLKFADYGSLDYGRNWGVVYDVGSWVDMQPLFSGDGESYMALDNFMTARSNGLATYRNSDFFGLVEGLSFALQYQGKNENNRQVQEQNGDGFGVSSIYDTGTGVSVGGAYSSSSRTQLQKTQVDSDGMLLPDVAAGKKAQAWTAGVKYDANDIYLAATYTETLNMTPFGERPVLDAAGDPTDKVYSAIANKTKNINVVAQYHFDFGLKPTVAWTKSTGINLLNSATGENDVKEDLMHFVSVGTSFDFNENMSVYADYKINMLKKDKEFVKEYSINKDDVVGVGMVYQF